MIVPLFERVPSFLFLFYVRSIGLIAPLIPLGDWLDSFTLPHLSFGSADLRMPDPLIATSEIH